MTLLRYLPAPIIAAPERILLKFACFMIGVGLLAGAHNRTGTLASFPEWAVYELGLTFTLGGLFALAGIFRRNRALERFGVALTAFASLSYAAALAIVFGPGRYVGIIVFGGLALACLTRLGVATAATHVIVATQAHSHMPPEEPGGNG